MTGQRKGNTTQALNTQASALSPLFRYGHCLSSSYNVQQVLLHFKHARVGIPFFSPQSCQNNECAPSDLTVDCLTSAHCSLFVPFFYLSLSVSKYTEPVTMSASTQAFYLTRRNKLIAALGRRALSDENHKVKLTPGCVR